MSGERRPLADEEVAALVAIAALPGVGPARLSAIHTAGSWARTWSEIVSGRALRLPALVGHLGLAPERTVERWAAAARLIEPEAFLTEHGHAGITVAVLGSDRYPRRLQEDPAPPAVVFRRGDPAVLDQPAVAVVGTRNATRLGRELAHELGRDLAAVGVAVVSGLALGIDGAAHRGVLAAESQAEVGTARRLGSPVGVIASGLDIAYPRRHQRLHAEVAEHGLLLSEVPLGRRPDAWRFPARNRIIAGLADVVVVVESRITGGSMHTADAALERGVPLLAVPGSIREASAAGTNELLANGAHPARDVEDVLVALGLGGTARSDRRRLPRTPTDPFDRQLLDALGWTPTTLEALVLRLDASVDTLAPSLVRLEADGWIERRDGWLERVGDRRA